MFNRISLKYSELTARWNFCRRAFNNFEKYLFVENTLDQLGYFDERTNQINVGNKFKSRPWFTYSSLEFLQSCDFSGKNVFEYGAGASTIYWENRGAIIHGVEHDLSWHENVSAKIQDPSKLLMASNANEYAAAITKFECQFDVVVIDGIWRNECLAACLGKLANGGMIILDNSDWYTDVYSDLLRNEFIGVDFNGFGPNNNYCWTTSIFFNSHADLLQAKVFPRPVNGISVQKGINW
jgi:hypothetical protein